MAVSAPHEISEIIDFAKKFADLICVDFCHNDLQYWEVFSKKFRFSPSDNVEDGFYPVRCIFDSTGKIKLKILNFIAREANWFTDRTEAEVLIRSISYYGHRHKFCPGILSRELQGLEGHLSSAAASKYLLYDSQPYEHYRSQECTYYYSSAKSSITKVVAFSRCAKCRKVYTNKMHFKKTLLKMTQEEMEVKIMKQIHPSSRTKITTLPPELAQIRRETQLNRQKQQASRRRKTQKKRRTHGF